MFSSSALVRDRTRQVSGGDGHCRYGLHLPASLPAQALQLRFSGAVRWVLASQLNMRNRLLNYSSPERGVRMIPVPRVLSHVLSVCCPQSSRIVCWLALAARFQILQEGARLFDSRFASRFVKLGKKKKKD